MKFRSLAIRKFEAMILITLVSWVLVLCSVRCSAESPVEPVVETQSEWVSERPEVKAVYNVPLDQELQFFIIQLCEKHHIDPAVVISIIDAESDFDADAVGDSGNSFGLMQIQARWHEERMDKLGATDLLNPKQNIAVGVDYLAELIDHYDGNLEMALMAYNAGQLGAYNNYFSQGIYSNDYSKEVLGEIENLTEGMITIVLQ